MPLTLACAGSATLQSAYFVVFLSRTNVAAGDLPPQIAVNITSIDTLDVGIAVWTLPAQPLPSHGTWSPTVTYAAGDTVGSSRYTIHSADNVTILFPLTYRSLFGSNLGHDPDNYDGWWTCTSEPPHATNSNFAAVPFGYALSPLPDKAALAAASWQAELGYTLVWSVAVPGDVVQLLDIYILLNYLVGSDLVRLISRPLTVATTTGSQGLILNPGINAQFQCWQTSGLSSAPGLTLSGFEPKIVDGMQPAATTGASYLTSIVASGGTPPYVYGIIAGSLPEGVTLDGTTGVISGTPTTSGVFDFTAQVTDSTGATAQVTCAAPIDCGGGGTAVLENYAL